MMKTLVYLSRAFVEFGPFTATEMLDFHSRGLLRDIDHIRLEGTEDWIAAEVWAKDAAAPIKATAVPVKAPAKPKAPAAKKEPAVKKEPEPKPKAPAKKAKKVA